MSVNVKCYFKVMFGLILKFSFMSKMVISKPGSFGDGDTIQRESWHRIPITVVICNVADTSFAIDYHMHLGTQQCLLMLTEGKPMVADGTDIS